MNATRIPAPWRQAGGDLCAQSSSAQMQRTTDYTWPGTEYSRSSSASLYHLCRCGKGQICSFFVGILIHCSSLTFDSVNHKQNQLCWLEFASPGGSQSATDDQRDRPAPPPPPCTSSSVDAHCVVEHVSSNCLNLQLT